MLGLDLAKWRSSTAFMPRLMCLTRPPASSTTSGAGVAGDGVGNLLQFRQGLGQLEEHHGGPGQEPGAQRELFEAAGDAQLPGVVAERPLTGDEVLVHADRTAPLPAALRAPGHPRVSAP